MQFCEICNQFCNQFCEKCNQNFDEDCIKSVDCFGYMGILMILILPIHVYGRSFYYFVPSSISSINILQFSVYRSFISLVKLILTCYILFDAILNDIVFLNFVSEILLSVCRNAMDFCILILYPIALLSLWQNMQGFLYIVLCHLKMVMILFNSNLYVFFFFFFLA